MTIERLPMRRGKPIEEKAVTLPPGTTESLTIHAGRMFLPTLGSMIKVVTPDMVEITHYGSNKPAEVYTGEEINEAGITGMRFFRGTLYRWIPTNKKGETSITPQLNVPAQV